MALTMNAKQTGDLIKSADWNDVVDEINQLGNNKVGKAGAQTMAGPLGIGTGAAGPAARLHVAGGQWNVSASEGDVKVGDGTFRFKVGVATGGAGAGDVRLRAHGGTNRMMLGGGTNDVLTVHGNRVGVGAGNITPQATLDVRGPLLFSDPSNPQRTLLYHRASESGSPANSGDGFRIRYHDSFFGNSLDALIIEKTDGNNNDPDGGVAFVNTGSDGTEETAMVIRGSGNVGIGTPTPGSRLHVVGTSDVRPDGGGVLVVGATNTNNIAIDGNEIMARNNGQTATLFLNQEGGQVRVNNIVVQSTRRIKADIAALSGQEAALLLDDLNPVTFSYKSDPQHRRTLGFIAEEAPDLVATTDRKAISYSSIVAVLSKVVRSQQEALAALRDEVEQLKRRAGASPRKQTPEG